jgi:outer membrane protein
MQRLRTIQQREHELDAAEARVERANNEIALSLGTTYPRVLFDKEMLEVRRSQRDRTRQQVERMRKLHRAGQVSKGEVLDVVSQLESEKLNLTQARNQLRSSRLELVQLLQLDREEGGELKVQAPPEDELEGDSIRKSPEEIFARSLSEMPSIEVAEASIQGAEDALRAAQGGRSPTLSLSGSYGTGFSGQRRRPVGEPEIAGFDTIGRTAGSGEAVLRPRIDQNVETVPFMEQLEDNMNQNVGLQLSIPIFQRMANHTRIKKAEVQLQKARLEKESTRNQLRQDVQKAYNDAIAAMRNYEASKKAVEARRESFSYAEARYEAGELNTVDYVNAKTKLVQARSEMLQAKYEQLFKRKVLRFYLGDPLTLQDTP